MAKTESKAKGSNGPGGLVVGLLFFGAFAAMGTFAAYALTYRPLAGLISARNWVETPCVITSSKLESHSDSDGTTYSIEITYTYEFGGREYEGDRYDFREGSSSGRKGKRKVVDAHKPGSEHVCYVNPEVPSKAVLNREPGLYLLWGLFPLPFLLVGYGGIFFLVFRNRDKDRSALGAGKAPSEAGAAPAPTGGELVLEPM